MHRFQSLSKSETPHVELDLLKQQVESNIREQNGQPHISASQNSSFNLGDSGTGMTYTGTAPVSILPAGDRQSRNVPQMIAAPSSEPATNVCSSACSTQAQSIQELNVDAQDIDECFALVVELAKSAIFSTERILPTIQALIILCTWQMPIDTPSKDITPTLAGAMIQMATNIGLHVYGTVQDFSRVAQPYDRQQRNFRTRLWAICLLTIQRVNNYRGLPPAVLPDTYSHEGYKEDPFEALPTAIRFQRKLNQVQSEAISQIERDALSRRPEDRNVVLPAAVSHALSRLSPLELECPSKLDRYFLRSAVLQISACSLIAPSSAIGDMNLLSMYGDACNLIELAVELDDEKQMSEYGPGVTNMILALAAFIVLRVGKSRVRDALDARRGQKCYFSVINMNEKHSIRSDDVAARATIILPQLWTSQMNIKRPDGTVDNLWLRCRNRFGLSLAFDTLWLWRQRIWRSTSPYEGVEGTCLSTGLDA
ncbi:uncharacterized protein Z518_08726 [Rhinocladiella mackenziei CBS 650.93]|uniref:Rhinocladiella mackenziei CBS 650.93 unplaced genomic scaffold supercont1.6, whole genome shotgun sequence n=1 Tax=Rhinocladiella mackenziei CBS 650.93 TaxID=1442369 RepID=A0A0D2IA89_9EURO|nr:uncharacterized protein Z518_08726 [Rhinocladiella mackenziei CBS 650.93]KIX02784.1 hypothetical protein Z518_08726 [Rhinocladiella mackenziei CBS 650.93]